jgi:hypothetical protein
MKQYIIETEFISQSQVIRAQCNAISFLNTGFTDIQINTFTLQPGEFFSISGNADEIDITQYQFRVTAPNGQVFITRKIYV